MFVSWKCVSFPTPVASKITEFAHTITFFAHTIQELSDKPGNMAKAIFSVRNTYLQSFGGQQKASADWQNAAPKWKM